MDYPVALTGIALTAAALLYVVYPLLASRQPAAPGLLTQRLRQLMERKEEVYVTLRELEFDHALGKLPDDDFRHLRHELEAEAMDLMAELDQPGAKAETLALETRIEEDIMALRQREPKFRHRCLSCGAERRPGDRFCSHCGAPHSPPGSGS